MHLTLPPELLDEIANVVEARLLARFEHHTQRLLPIREAATTLGMTEGALRKHVQRGNIPTIRMSP